MANVLSYPVTTNVDYNDVFLLDGLNGTRTLKAKDFLYSVGSVYSTEEPALGGLDEREDTKNAIVPRKRMLWRGKYLGNSVTDAQYAAIADGTFKDLCLGDYWIINPSHSPGNNHIYRIVDFDYWYGTGDTPCITHHVVIMPDAPLPYTGPNLDTVLFNMNDTATTKDGYVNSKMYTTHLESIRQRIFEHFGSSHVLTHNEWLSSGVGDDGVVFGTTSTNVNVIIPSGTMIFSFSPFPSNEIYWNSFDNQQLAAFKINKKISYFTQYDYWLRDVARSTSFGVVDKRGFVTFRKSDQQYAIRPVFGVIG